MRAASACRSADVSLFALAAHQLEAQEAERQLPLQHYQQRLAQVPALLRALVVTLRFDLCAVMSQMKGEREALAFELDQHMQVRRSEKKPPNGMISLYSLYCSEHATSIGR